MIDRLRHDLEQKLEQLLAEADKLRGALRALDPRGASSSPRAPAATSQTRRRAPRPSATPKASPASPRARAASGATKTAVLDALARSGAAMTAGDVAAVTGLGRGAVSSTLSKLAQTGEIRKAERGYRLPSPATPPTTPAAGESNPT